MGTNHQTKGLNEKQEEESMNLSQQARNGIMCANNCKRVLSAMQPVQSEGGEIGNILLI